MPYKSESLQISDPFLDRRVKLLPCQRKMVIWWRENKGLSQRSLANLFGVSRRLITFILDPDRFRKTITRTLKMFCANTGTANRIFLAVPAIAGLLYPSLVPGQGIPGVKVVWAIQLFFF